MLPLAQGALLVVVLVASTAALAQALDPVFPTRGSSVTNTVAAYLDLAVEDEDAAALLVPRSSAGGYRSCSRHATPAPASAAAIISG
jgi:hypothetical protein